MLKIILFLTFAITSIFTFNAPAQAAPFESTYYVRVDHHHHSAFMFDKNFKQMPNDFFNPKTSAILFPKDKTRWFRGVHLDVVRRESDGSLKTLSSDPAYSEMIHHINFSYIRTVPPEKYEAGNKLKRFWNRVKKFIGSEASGKYKKNVCGQFPFIGMDTPIADCSIFATGSELTKFHMPEGYGFKVRGGYLKGKSWHWDNPAGVSDEEDIYLRFVLYWDDKPDGYRNVYTARLAVDVPSQLFCVQPGSSTFEGPVYEVNRPLRIIAVGPHIHDHSNYLEVRKNGKQLHRFTPGKSAIKVTHSSCGGKPTALHASANHLPAGGLTVWTPGEKGPVLKAGDKLNVFASYSNPHDRPIDTMIIFHIFWEDLQDSQDP